MLEYTTIYRLRQEGFPIASLSNADAKLKIQEASEYLSDLLGQWFVPVRDKKRLDGGGSSIIYFSNRIPFLEVLEFGLEFTASVSGEELPSRIDILLGNADRTVYNPDEFVIRGRYIELLFSNLFAGRGNVVVDCYTGYMDWFGKSSRNYAVPSVLTTTGTLIEDTDEEVVLVSTDGLKVRDVIIFEKADSTREVLGTAIIHTIDRATKTVEFDAIETINGADVPVASRVLSFGAVPRLIERATILLVKKLMPEIYSDDYDEAVGATKLKSEKTDRYSYTLFGDKDGGGVGITGDPMVDSQLSKFAEPHHVDLV